MTDRMTMASAPYAPSLQAHGRLTRAEMIKRYRDYYAEERERAVRALALADDEITVTTFVGPWARKNETVVEDDAS